MKIIKDSEYVDPIANRFPIEKVKEDDDITIYSYEKEDFVLVDDNDKSVQKAINNSLDMLEKYGRDSGLECLITKVFRYKDKAFGYERLWEDNVFVLMYITPKERMYVEILEDTDLEIREELSRHLDVLDKYYPKRDE